MRFIKHALGITPVVLAFVASGASNGCSNDAEDCNERLRCGTSGAGGDAGQGGAGNGGDGGGGQGGQGGGPPAGCIPSEADGPVENSCGIFVSSSKGVAGAAGTKEAPVLTIAEALTLADGAPIYLCAEAFDEAVVMEAGTDVFGALNCDDDWGYTPATKSQVNGPADMIAWKISGAGTTIIADVAVTAATATDIEGASLGSSIAMLVDGSTVDLQRCDLTAGDGANGIDGEDGIDLDDDLDNDGENGAPGNTMPAGTCAMEVHFGGMGGPKTCDGTNVAGGMGGGALGEPGSTGQEGLPTSLGPEGNGGVGQSIAGASSCDSGTEGGDGTPGEVGDGGITLGTLSATGYEGASGTAGTNGGPGQGGGGGGASACTGGSTGPSGGGGGSGGCGGKGATGGTAGGSSLALVSIAATVTLTACTLTAGAGGIGGAGGDRQMGGNPGAGGPQTGGACSGGNGGPGGTGGSGGGGRGGHSLAIAFAADAPKVDRETMLMHGSSGMGGLGGTFNTPAGDGDNGLAVDSQAFD
jgi:hypothetical protein